jgi:hypothetical protein
MRNPRFDAFVVLYLLNQNDEDFLHALKSPYAKRNAALINWGVLKNGPDTVDFFDDLLKPELIDLVNNNKQKLIMSIRERMLGAEQLAQA